MTGLEKMMSQILEEANASANSKKAEAAAEADRIKAAAEAEADAKAARDCTEISSRSCGISGKSQILSRSETQNSAVSCEAGADC